MQRGHAALRSCRAGVCPVSGERGLRGANAGVRRNDGALRGVCGWRRMPGGVGLQHREPVLRRLPGNIPVPRRAQRSLPDGSGAARSVHVRRLHREPGLLGQGRPGDALPPRRREVCRVLDGRGVHGQPRCVILLTAGHMRSVHHRSRLCRHPWQACLPRRVRLRRMHEQCAVQRQPTWAAVQDGGRC